MTKAKKTLRILVITNLYPSARFPRNGIFTEHRIRHLVASGRVDVRVVSPVPWFPSRSKMFGRYGDYARVERRGMRHGIAVDYPRYLIIPKIGAALSAFMLALALVPTVKRLLRSGFNFDLIDSYYFYPDGVAAAILGVWFRKPVVITAFGTDVSIIPNNRLLRRQIQWAAERADGITTVCQALKDALVDLGASASKIRVVLHGVDFELFRPAENREQIRHRLGLSGPTLITVGHLTENKGHHLAISALRELPDMQLLIAGDGEQKQYLQELARDEGVADRVRFLGLIRQQELPDYYNAADALILASGREGIANVLMEALACGTPVVATAVWGAPEVITSDVAGVLIEERSAKGVADGVRQLFANRPARAETRRFVEPYTWGATTQSHLALLESILDGADGEGA
jgi:glycosyltransferase involved in cell wall biosynthesis